MAETSGGDVFVAVLFSENQIVGFFPYQFPSGVDRLLRRAERVGGEMSDYCGVVPSPSMLLDDAHLLRLAKLHSFQFSHLDANQVRNGFAAEKPVIGHMLRTVSTGADYWKELGSRNHRLVQDTNRCLGKLQREVGPIAFEFDAVDRPEQLERLIEMKRDQYRKTGVADALLDSGRRRLLHQLYANQHAECRGVLSTLFAGDEMVAAHFGLVAGEVLHYWFPVYENRFSRYSPGRLLYKFILESLTDFGVKVIDNGAGDAPYKNDLSNHSYQVYSGRWSRKTPLALISAAKSSIGWRMQKALASK